MSYKTDEYTNHTGGAYGADTYGCVIGIEYGFNNHNHYRPYNNTNLSRKLRDKGLKPFILDKGNLDVARNKINKLLGKDYQDNIMGNLQARNYYQVGNSDAIYCFSRKRGEATVYGGTNTALQLAIELDVEAYVYDIDEYVWYKYNKDSKLLELCKPPILTKNYAIIGSRDCEKYSVKDNKTGCWGVRGGYIGEHAEIIVKKTIAKLYEDTLKAMEEIYD